MLNNSKIINGKIITPQGIIKDHILYIKDGVIDRISKSNDPYTGELIDANGCYVSPGFIDIHLHGGGDYDFMDNELAGYLKIAETHARHGTTSMMPTTLSCEMSDLLATINLYEQVSTMKYTGAQFIGLHIEGPYFAMNQKGAQDPRYIKNPNPAEYKKIIDSTNAIKRWSSAPELPGAIDFGRYLISKNILPAIAHTDAIYEEVLTAFKAGYTHITHLYSAMLGVTRRNAFRYAGAVEAAYLIDEMTVEVIADGVHMPAPLLKLAYKIKGADNIALITDAMRGATMEDGPSILGSKKDGLNVIIEDNVAKLIDRSAFAGSVATTDRLVKNMIDLAEAPLTDAIKMMTATPAKIINVADRKGSLQKGKDADIVLFDEDITIHKTIVAGEIIYQKNKEEILQTK